MTFSETGKEKFVEFTFGHIWKPPPEALPEKRLGESGQLESFAEPLFGSHAPKNFNVLLLIRSRLEVHGKTLFVRSLYRDQMSTTSPSAYLTAVFFFASKYFCIFFNVKSLPHSKCFRIFSDSSSLV